MKRQGYLFILAGLVSHKKQCSFPLMNGLSLLYISERESKNHSKGPFLARYFAKCSDSSRILGATQKIYEYSLNFLSICYAFTKSLLTGTRNKCIMSVNFYGGYRKMKSTGIVRPVDSLGRIVLPIELRRIMDIECKDSIEIFVDGSYIMLKKYQPSCIFCDSMDDIRTYNGKNVCKNCIDKMSKL